jgi:hypothetical protein
VISTLLRVGRWLIGAAQALGEIGRGVRGMRRGVLSDQVTDDTDPFPLTHRDVEIIRKQIESAQPPSSKPPSSRYDAVPPLPTPPGSAKTRPL